MIQSMTGYGRGECSKEGISAVVELRSVNSRFFELSSRLPRSLSLRENEIKEILSEMGLSFGMKLDPEGRPVPAPKAE